MPIVNVPIISVPANITSSVLLTFSSAVSASLATDLLTSIYEAAAANTLVTYPESPVAGAVNEFVITEPGAITVPAGYDVVIDAVTSGTVTITGNGASNELVVAGAGSFEYDASGGSGTVIAGVGYDTIKSTGDSYIQSGDASYATYNSAVALAPSIITNPGLYNFTSALNNDIINEASGPTTVQINNSGSTTVSALTNGGVYDDNQGTLTFVNYASSTVIASATSGPSTIFAGNTGMLVTQGADTASLIFVNGSGNSSIVAGAAGGVLAFDGAGGTINLSDSLSSAFNYLVGGSGAETLNAGATRETVVLVAGQANAYATLGSVSADAFFGGSGSSTIVGGTTSSGAAVPDLYAFVNGNSGGSDLILNWGAASGLVFLGYGTVGDAAIKAAIAAAPTKSSTVSITLPDSTNIIVTGVNGATVNLNNNPLYLG